MKGILVKTISIHVHPLVLAAVAALGIPAVAIAAGTILAPPVTVTGTSSSALFSSTNNGTGTAISTMSVQGKAITAIGHGTAVYAKTTNPSLTTHNDASGVGGYDASSDQGTMNNGVYGQSRYGAGVRGFSTVGFGIVGGSKFGVGVSGNSTFANGIVGQTSQPYHTLSLSGSGVMGVDATTDNPFNNGVLGTSPSGTGVLGKSSFANGVVGQTSNSYPNGTNNQFGSGVMGIDATTDNNPFNNGVFGTSPSGTGVYGASTNGSGVLGNSTNWMAVAAYSPYIAIYAVGQGRSDSDGAFIIGDYIGVVSQAPAGTGTYPLMLTDLSANILDFTNGNGDLFVHGTINNFARVRNGNTVVSFGVTSASPSVEDTGSGQLVDGMAVVNLDPTFVQAIDPRQAYHVMLTPDGDTLGLFVASKRPDGFVVREVRGGHGSLSFDYHVYAAKFDHASERMILMTPAQAAAFLPHVKHVARHPAKLRSKLR
jgi:hypothetical protein